MKTDRQVSRAATILAAAALCAAAVSARAPIRTADQTAPSTLEHMKVLARDAAEHAGIYANVSREELATPYDGSTQLHVLRTDVNQMGKDLALLNAERGSLSPWERRAVDQMTPLLQTVAADTAQAIDSFDSNALRLWTPANENAAQKLTRDTEKIASTASFYVKHGNTLE